MLKLSALCSWFLGLAIALAGGQAIAQALTTPAPARNYDAVVAFADSVIYLDPSTVKADGEIKTLWAYTVYISTNNLGIDWTSEHLSIDCKNDRMVTYNVIGYRMNGDVVGQTQDDPNIQARWIDVPPETAAAGEEDAACHGNVLGTDSAASFSEVATIARRRLIQIAAKHPQLRQPMQQSSTRPPAWRSMLREVGRALQQQASTPRPAYSPAYSSSAPGTDQPVYSASECVGPIVAGVCHGAILPNQATHPVCHGEMLNGTCTGPMF